MTAPTNDTTVLAALNALVTIVKAAVGDTQVIYGPPVDEVEASFVAIGYTGSADEPAVVFDFDVADAALGRDGEVYDVACLLSCWDGDGAFVDVDVAAFALLRTVRAAIAANRKLGGAVAVARVTSGSLVHDVQKGAVASIPFTVHVEAWSR